MKDGRGVERRQCRVEGCNCPEYKVSKDGGQICITCHHPPVRHVAVPSSVSKVYTSQHFFEENESSSEDDAEEEWEEESEEDEEDNEIEDEDSDEYEEFDEMQMDEYVRDYGYKNVRYDSEDLVRDGMKVEYNMQSFSPNFVDAQSLKPATIAPPHIQSMTSNFGSSSFTGPPSQRMQGLCCKLPGCMRTRCANPSGGHFDFCGKGHAQKYIEQQKDMKLCKLPGCGRPAHQGFEFCGRSHGLQFNQMALNTGNLSVSTPPRPVSTSSMSPREKCKIPSCTKNRFMTDGVLEDFCGRTCANAAQQQGMQLQNLWLLPPGSQEYTAVSNQFFTSWKKGTAPARNSIRGILCIDVSRLQKNYTSYVNNQLKGSPNEVTYFHGTTLCCNIVSTSNFCGNSTCGACGISQRGFLQNKIGTHVKFQRLGKAFYFSPNSSKCHEYSEGHSGCRALILCRIAQGKVYQATSDMTHLSSPPPGYDSVSAFPSHHRGMNYGEVATYAEHAALPTHIIVYQHQGEKLLLYT